MAVSARKVQNKRDSNGVLTGKPGTVYDVNIKYNAPEGKKTYSKKGFATKKEATQHEAEMKAKLANPVYTPVVVSQGKQTVKEYLEEWVENHGKANLRPSTFAGYKSHIKNHILPYIGHVQLNQLTPAMLDNIPDRNKAHFLACEQFTFGTEYRFPPDNGVRDRLDAKNLGNLPGIEFGIGFIAGIGRAFCSPFVEVHPARLAPPALGKHAVRRKFRT